MGSRLALLILVLALAPSAWGAADSSCLSCHDSHYEAHGTCVACHRGDPRSGRLNIAHHGVIPGDLAHFDLPESPVVERGRKRLEEAACRRCHVMGGKGNRLAADLDKAVVQSLPEEIERAIEKPVLLMPEFGFSPKRRAEIINALYAEAQKQVDPPADSPRVVHFSGEERKDNPFVKHCGSCHRAMTVRYGGLGEGEVAPNLSGLLSPFYPPTYKRQEPWTPDSLKKWLENPRKARPGARMAPVKLKSDRDLEQILSDLGTSEAFSEPK